MGEGVGKHSLSLCVCTEPLLPMRIHTHELFLVQIQWQLMHTGIVYTSTNPSLMKTAINQSPASSMSQPLPPLSLTSAAVNSLLVASHVATSVIQCRCVGTLYAFIGSIYLHANYLLAPPTFITTNVIDIHTQLILRHSHFCSQVFKWF